MKTVLDGLNLESILDSIEGVQSKLEGAGKSRHPDASELEKEFEEQLEEARNVMIRVISIAGDILAAP